MPQRRDPRPVTLDRRSALAALSLGIAAPAITIAAPAITRAQAFPDRPLTIIVPTPPGGSNDLLARLLGDGMSRDLGQSVVTLNLSGSTVAGQRLVQTRPDGHTILVNNVGFAASATLFRKLPYDVLQSFAPLGLVSEVAMLVVARRDFPADDIAGLIEVMKREGTRLNLATNGLTSSSHLGAMLLQQAAGATATIVPFRGSGPALTELLAGRIDIFVDQVTSALPHLRAGAIKGYLVTSDRRVPGLDLPTGLEAGLPILRMTTWSAAYAVAGTPEPIQERLSAALRFAIAEPIFRQRLAEVLTEPASPERTTPAYHRQFLAAEVARWKPLIEAFGMYAD